MLEGKENMVPSEFATDSGTAVQKDIGNAINAVDAQGRTPLLMAAEYRKLNVLRELIAKNANIDA